MSLSLFTTQTPSLPDVFEGSPLTVGITLIFNAAGTVSGSRFYVPATVGAGTYTATFWQVTSDDSSGTGTGTLLAFAQFASLTPGTWASVAFTSGVAVDTTHAYVIALRSTEGRYAATGGLFTSALVNGSITGIQDGTTQRGFTKLVNGRFTGGIASYPESTFQSNGYFIDVLFDPSSPTVNLAASLGASGSMAAALTREAPLPATLGAAGSMTAGLTREVPLAASLAATGSLAATLTANTTVNLAATLTASGSMRATVSSPPVGPVDLIGTPAARQLLAALTEQLAALPNPPAKIQLRVGQETGPLIGPNTDECCAGLAWVRIADIYPSWDSFPAQDNTWNPCGPLAYAVVLEMGVSFCMPWSDSDDTLDGLEPPSTADWESAFTTQMLHQTLMRRAAACAWTYTQRRAVGGWTQLPVEGGCTGGKLTVTVSVMNPCSDC